MGLFDKKADSSDSELTREVKLYSPENDCLTIHVSSKTCKIQNDLDVLFYIRSQFKEPLPFRIGNGEYRLSPVKRIKLGEIQNENSSQSSK